MKQIISEVIEIPEEKEDSKKIKKQLKNDHMFSSDDRDRFGQHLFPIAPKVKIPGPGSYEIHDSIEDKAKRVLVIEEQRKVLKEWFNN